MARADRMTVEEVVGKVLLDEHADVIREAVKAIAAEMKELEVSELIGAERGERRPVDRATHRNGYRPRRWDTRAGEVERQIPKIRQGSYLPSFLEPRRRSEQALLAVVQQAYVCGARRAGSFSSSRASVCGSPRATSAASAKRSTSTSTRSGRARWRAARGSARTSRSKAASLYSASPLVWLSSMRTVIRFADGKRGHACWQHGGERSVEGDLALLDQLQGRRGDERLHHASNPEAVARPHRPRRVDARLPWGARPGSLPRQARRATRQGMGRAHVALIRDVGAAYPTGRAPFLSGLNKLEWQLDDDHAERRRSRMRALHSPERAGYAFGQ
jgi:hypothetical protein